MQTDSLHTLILFHAGLGGLALLVGLGALIVVKGSALHKTFGKLFYYSMLGSAICSLYISVQDKHQNAFLFSIGVFTLYLIIGGKRALRFKQPQVNYTYDILLALVMIGCGFLMVFVPTLINGSVNIVLAVFGTGGMVLGVKDLRLFNHPNQMELAWQNLHIGKMVGGYIAAVTAFIVVNELLPGIIGWLAPTVIGVGYIQYQFRKKK
ncbi:MAG: DUF2306 domain-containing protein [Bacteroidetes bacterium B1(2017)]|nr:MAG: DUF2306 domain-containing protein [Bacteroidetes bacterium B1(2017)]